MFAMLSLAVATGSAYISWQLVERYETRLIASQAPVEVLSVVVADRPLQPGETLDLGDVRVERRFIDGPVESVFQDLDEVVGDRVAHFVLEGEVLRKERLLAPGTRLRANELLGEGMRAVTVRVDRAGAVGGLLEPGFLVDVMVTIRPEANAVKAKWVTETILQDIRVLSIGDKVVDGSSTDGRQSARDTWVTLEVGPDDAERVALSAARGQIHLAIRGSEDHDVVKQGNPLATNALVGLPEGPVKPVPVRAPVVRPAHVVEVIEGVDRSYKAFDARGKSVSEAP